MGGSQQAEVPLLNVSDRAVDLIRDLLDNAQLPAGAGLRIAQRDDHPALAMALTEAAGPDDTVLSERNVAVFVGPIAARRLDGHTLDARTNEVGSAFYVRD